MKHIVSFIFLYTASLYAQSLNLIIFPSDLEQPNTGIKTIDQAAKNKPVNNDVFFFVETLLSDFVTETWGKKGDWIVPLQYANLRPDRNQFENVEIEKSYQRFRVCTMPNETKQTHTQGVDTFQTLKMIRPFLNDPTLEYIPSLNIYCRLIFGDRWFYTPNDVGSKRAFSYDDDLAIFSSLSQITLFYKASKLIKPMSKVAGMSEVAGTSQVTKSWLKRALNKARSIVRTLPFIGFITFQGPQDNELLNQASQTGSAFPEIEKLNPARFKPKMSDMIDPMPLLSGILYTKPSLMEISYSSVITLLPYDDMIALIKKFYFIYGMKNALVGQKTQIQSVNVYENNQLIHKTLTLTDIYGLSLPSVIRQTTMPALPLSMMGLR